MARPTSAVALDSRSGRDVDLELNRAVHLHAAVEYAVVPPIFLERRSSAKTSAASRSPYQGLPGDTPVSAPVTLETPDTVEIIMDAGRRARGRDRQPARQTIVIAGRKDPVCGHTEAAFHLAERTFGRFVRPVRVGGAIDASRAEATLSGGELRVRIPRIEERRGREIRIPIKAE